MRKASKSLIPTVATLCNLGAGFIAIALALEGDPYLAALLVISANR
jgi:phosphatidylserine synthase